MSEIPPPEFHLARIATDFHEIVGDALAAMRDGGPEYETFASGLREQLAALHEERLVRVAFVGQYSAGKSTLIAALTGRDDIRIDADIATDRATDYDWNGILLTDTPGLYTERTDHDAITYQTLAAADLLIFTVTSNLFDRLVLANFITLAYQQGYRQKMLLVVNKMNMEDRPFDELVTNYRASLARALRGEGYSLDDFRLVFVDAADYREGRHLDEPDLIALSNFGAFLDALNDFVAERGVFGRLDTPIRSARRQVEQALLSQQADEQNRRFFQLLDRLEQRILRAQHDTQIELRRITGDLWSRITGRSGELVVRIGDPEVDLTNESREVERFIIEAVDVAQRDLEQRLTHRTEELHAEMREVLDSDLGQHYLGMVAASGLELERPRQTGNTTLRRNVETLNAVLQKASQDYIGLAGVAGTTGRVGSLHVAGSQAHTQIYAIGKFFGYKFRPWEAVKLTKNIANVAKFVGPALTLVGTMIDAYDLYAQQAHEHKLMAAQNTCATEFMEVATDIERQFQHAFAAYSAEVYTPALDLIATRRAQAIRDQTQRSALFQRLDACHVRLDTLLQTIYQAQ